MSVKHSSFPADFRLEAFFAALPENLKVRATNGESHLKILKAQAKCLRSYLVSHFAFKVTSAQALELAAHSYCFSDYNQARASLLESGRAGSPDSCLLVGSLGDSTAGSATRPSDSAPDIEGQQPWVDASAAWQEGGFFAGGDTRLKPARLPAGAVVTALNQHAEDPPGTWYHGDAKRYSKKTFLGKGSVILNAVDSWAKYEDLAATLVERAQRLAQRALLSYLVLERLNVSDHFIDHLLSVRRPFVPVICGYDTSVCGVPEGVPDRLWRTSAYPLFISRLESTDAVRETVPMVARSLAVPEDRAFSLLMHVPENRYLRIPPAQPGTGERRG
jgi:hypothetical protein